MNRVKIKNTANGGTMEYTIVADSEANLKEKKIGTSTPIAQGLLGHDRGRRGRHPRACRRDEV